MPSEVYDVIVAGSGPAGASAAYFLGEGGLRVLVLEKESLPRYKTCGGGLSIEFLQHQFPFSFEPVLNSTVNAFCYARGSKIITIPARPGVVGMVMRDKFDQFLLEHCRAEIIDNLAIRSIAETSDSVNVTTADGRQFSGRYLIGADGANSTVAHALGLRPKRTLAAAIEAEAPAPAQVMKRFCDRPVFIFGEICQGYLWIFPKAGHLSVGIAALHPRRGELQATLKKVMQRYQISLEDVPLHGHPIPIYTHRQPISTARTLLVGDAAGLADPLSGEGIRLAIKSGRLAAEAILNGHPESYSQAVFRRIGLDHLSGLLAAHFFYHAEGLCLFLGAPNPFVTRAIEDLLSDRANSIDVVLRGVGTLPVFWLTEIVAGLAGALGAKQLSRRIREWVYLGPGARHGRPATAE